MVLVSYEEATELAAVLLGRGDIDVFDITEDQVDELSDQLASRFGIDIQELADLAGALLPLVDVGVSPLTRARYKGFGNGGVWICKAKLPAPAESA